MGIIRYDRRECKIAIEPVSRVGGLGSLRVVRALTVEVRAIGRLARPGEVVVGYCKVGERPTSTTPGAIWFRRGGRRSNCMGSILFHLLKLKGNPISAEDNFALAA